MDKVWRHQNERELQPYSAAPILSLIPLPDTTWLFHWAPFGFSPSVRGWALCSPCKLCFSSESLLWGSSTWNKTGAFGKKTDFCVHGRHGRSNITTSYVWLLPVLWLTHVWPSHTFTHSLSSFFLFAGVGRGVGEVGGGWRGEHPGTFENSHANVD